MPDILTRDQIIRKATSESHKRSFTIERAAADAVDNRTVELAFASDTPCEHFSYRLWDYVDVALSMQPSAMRTQRLTSGAALLADHDPTDQIGVVDSFSIDPKDGMARAKVRFSRSARGQEIYQDVVDGIRRNVSVGFSIHKLVLEEENEEGNDLYRADDWEPFELSIVSIPADISVGVGRSAEFTKSEKTEIPIMPKENETPESPVISDPEVQTREAEDARKVADVQNQIKFGATFGFEKEVREASLANPDFSMADARMLVQQLKAKADDLATRVSPPRQITTDARTLGGAFISSPEYQSVKPGGRQKRTIMVETDILPNQLHRATYSGTGDSLTGYDRVPGVFQLGAQPPTVADLFMQATTTSPTVRYMREATYTNAADWTTEGDDKPEATFDLEEVDASVRKAAVWSKVTDETLEDFSDIRPYIDQRLSFMLRTKIDSDLLNGTGTAPQIAGLLGTTGIQTSEMAGNTAVKLAEAILHAITLIRSVGFFEPDALVIHPNDYEKLRLATDGNTQYYGGGFFANQYGVGPTPTAPPIWGLRVVQTTAISEIDLATPAAGNKGPIVGAFNLGGAVYYRNGVAIESTNTDGDDFIMNLTTIRVEQRLALAVYRPKAFCRVINAA